jgi:predicted TIM-barrel fold metal-dependent hydrolase
VFGRNFLIEFQDKLLFARDNFGSELMDYLKELDLPEEAFDKIAYQNAQKLVSAS